MDNAKEVKDFYEEDLKYQMALEEIKKLIYKVVTVNMDELLEKIKSVDEKNEFDEFYNLFNAVTGKKTNKYFCCEDQEYVKYYGLKCGEIYNVDKLNPEIKARYSTPVKLKLHVREVLARYFSLILDKLIIKFEQNYGNVDGNLSTFESGIIKDEDIEYLKTLKLYLSKLMDKENNLKILTVEEVVYLNIKEKEEYNKKNNIEKMFYNMFKTKKWRKKENIK